MITTAAAACDDLLIPVNAPDVRQRFAQARQSGLRAKEAAESWACPKAPPSAPTRACMTAACRSCRCARVAAGAARAAGLRHRDGAHAQ
jgi:hypothetical protein